MSHPYGEEKQETAAIRRPCRGSAAIQSIRHQEHSCAEKHGENRHEFSIDQNTECRPYPNIGSWGVEIRVWTCAGARDHWHGWKIDESNSEQRKAAQNIKRHNALRFTNRFGNNAVCSARSPRVDSYLLHNAAL